jgi:hypothetical protein
MPGEESNLPTRRQRKVEGIHNKSEKVNRASGLTV